MIARPRCERFSSSVAAAKLDLPLIHLDALYWQPGWTEMPKDQWRAVIDGLCERDAWVMDGNYGGTLYRRLSACDTVIFLDLPRSVCVWRTLKRRWQFRHHLRPDMGPGCPERLDWQFLRWVWNYRRDRRPGILAKLERLSADGKRVIILRSVADVDLFLNDPRSDWADWDSNPEPID